MAFAGLSFGLLSNAATATIEGERILSSGPKTLVLGASLACFVSLLLAELASWVTSLMAPTRRETVVAELEASPGQALEHAEVQSLLERYAGGSDGENEHAQGVEAGSRKWLDVRHKDVAEVLQA
jgi:hypothetical protein